MVSCADIYVDLHICMDLRRFNEIYVYLRLLAWFHVQVFTWISMDLHVFSSIYLDLRRFT